MWWTSGFPHIKVYLVLSIYFLVCPTRADLRTHHSDSYFLLPFPKLLLISIFPKWKWEMTIPQNRNHIYQEKMHNWLTWLICSVPSLGLFSPWLENVSGSPRTLITRGCYFLNTTDAYSGFVWRVLKLDCPAPCLSPIQSWLSQAERVLKGLNESCSFQPIPLGSWRCLVWFGGINSACFGFANCVWFLFFSLTGHFIVEFCM